MTSRKQSKGFIIYIVLLISVSLACNFVRGEGDPETPAIDVDDLAELDAALAAETVDEPPGGAGVPRSARRLRHRHRAGGGRHRAPGVMALLPVRHSRRLRRRRGSADHGDRTHARGHALCRLVRPPGLRGGYDGGRRFLRSPPLRHRRAWSPSPSTSRRAARISPGVRPWSATRY